MALVTQGSSNYGLISFAPNNFTAGSLLVKSGAGVLKGLFVASASGTAVLQFLDATSSAGTSVLIGSFTPIAATYYNLGKSQFGTGLFIQGSGSFNATVLYF